MPTKRNSSTDTFDNPSEAFGGIYARFMLDHIVELSTHLAYDVVKRPGQFEQIPASIADILENFRTKLGHDPNWPDASQRGQLFDVFLGPTFTTASAAVRRTVLGFADGATAANRELHENALLDAATAVRDLLVPTRQQAEHSAYRPLASIFAQAVEVMQDKSVRAALGNFPQADEGWPLESASSPVESRLLDELASSAGGAACQSVGRYYFGTLQRTAYFGRHTLNAILTSKPLDAEWTKAVLDHGYRWTRALNDLLPVQSVVRAWKEPQFRAELTEPQRRHLPPNPAGDVDTSNANLQSVEGGGGAQAAGQTSTVNGEVCCSTTPMVSCDSHCPRPRPSDDPIIGAPSTHPCCTHHC